MSNFAYQFRRGDLFFIFFEGHVDKIPYDRSVEKVCVEAIVPYGDNIVAVGTAYGFRYSIWDIVLKNVNAKDVFVRGETVLLSTDQIKGEIVGIGQKFSARKAEGTHLLAREKVAK